ncbi:MAG: septal ring factor EnvC (AmiA/AmiB activator) [Burkholderiaceae bacterium]|jgi:septal ring factor EnvC (AmiA/AmiB activator)
MHHFKKLLLLVALAGTCVAPASATKVSERSKQKEAAEAQRTELQRQLDTLESSISKTVADSDKATEALGKSAKAISEANRTLHELEAEQGQTERKLIQLSQQQARLTKLVDDQQTQLSNLLRKQYVAGNDDRIKLLLSGDNPNRINRDLEYLGYVSQAQAALIGTLRSNLQAIERNKAEAEEAHSALAEIAVEARDQRTALENEKARRATLLASLSTKLASQRKEAGDLKRDDQRLSSLVNKLDELIETQRKADAAAAEQRKLKQLAAERTAQAEEARKQALQDSKRARPNAPPRTPAPANNPDAIDNDEPPKKIALRNELQPETGVGDGTSGRNFNGLRGKLRLPVKGDIVTRFGATRGEGPDSKGLFIRAAEGTEIRAIAEGKVVFADWLRGFGNLIIVDHGNQYLTIYGNNQSVLKRPGDVVKSGDTIATAGNSGGNEQSGLYFEMRHQGRAFDPLGWVTTR